MSNRESEVRERTDEAFKDHVVTELHNCGLYRSWHCGRPGDCFDSFTVTTIPGHLFVTGDIGDLIVSRCEDMISWCRGAVDSTSYFAEKVPKCIAIREFSEDVCREWLLDLQLQVETDQEDEDPGDESDASEILVLIDDVLSEMDDGLTEEKFLVMTEDRWVDDPPGTRDAVRWLIGKLDSVEVPNVSR